MRYLLLACSLLVAGALFGQYKIAYLNTANLIETMPEARHADSVLNKMANRMEEQKRNMQMELQMKISNLQGAADTLSEAIFGIRYKEVQDLEARIKSFNQGAQEELSKRQDELYTPILNRVEQAIDDVAKEKGYRYVLEESAGVILYSEESDNIMPLVRKKLGLPELPPEPQE